VDDISGLAGNLEDGPVKERLLKLMMERPIFDEKVSRQGF